MLDKVYLTVGSLWLDEDDVAMDFVRYHRYIGVDRFIILDREYERISKLFEGQDDVIVKPYPNTFDRIHSTAWRDIILDCQTEYSTTWLALIDADQVLVPVATDNMKDVLKDYEEFASVALNWHTFGSNGHKTKTEGSLYERFTARAVANAEINAHCQAICQPSRTLAVQTADPHHVKLPLNEMCVNTSKRRVVGPFNKPPLHNVAWIAHFINKSNEEHEIKWRRGRADIYGQKMPHTLFDDYEVFANAEQELRVKELWQQAKEQVK